MREPGANFITDKNAEPNKPIRLYRINISDTPEVSGEEDLYFAEYDVDVNFFKDVNTAQTYTAFPLTYKTLDENSTGHLSGLEISIANASREIQAFLELRDGLRGRKVTIRQVFADYLADNTAYIEDIYYIDSVTANESVVQFKLTTKLDLMELQLPRRRYSRNHCQFRYKGAGCWPATGSGGALEEPDDWLATGAPLVPPNPLQLYDGLDAFFSEASARIIQESTGGVGSPLNMQGLTKANGTLFIDLKCVPFANLTADSHIRLTSHDDPGGTPTNEWKLADLSGEGITASFVEYSFALSGFATVNGELDVTALRYILVDNTCASGNTAAISFRTPRIVWSGAADVCDKTLRQCQWHGNADRYGGFPSVPSRRISRE